LPSSHSSLITFYESNQTYLKQFHHSLVSLINKGKLICIELFHWLLKKSKDSLWIGLINGREKRRWNDFGWNSWLASP